MENNQLLYCSTPAKQARGVPAELITATQGAGGIRCGGPWRLTLSKLKPAWKPLVTFSVLLVVALWFLLSQALMRQEFVGHVDPVSGHRCRFTIAPDWRILDTGPKWIKTSPDSVFFGPPSNPIRTWIAVHLFHESDWRLESPGIYFETVVEPGEPRLLLGESIVTQRHFMIDGCPATVTHSVIESYGSAPQIIRLWVWVSRQSIRYDLYATVETQDTDSIEHEMQAIISSFHVEKATVSSSAKQ